MPEDIEAFMPDVRRLDCSRLQTLAVPQIKLIRAYIEDHDPSFRISEQSIANALRFFGVRVPNVRPRRRTAKRVP
jgi:hypothetical protein